MLGSERTGVEPARQAVSERAAVESAAERDSEFAVVSHCGAVSTHRSSRSGSVGQQAQWLLCCIQLATIQVALEVSVLQFEHYRNGRYEHNQSLKTQRALECL